MTASPAAIAQTPVGIYRITSGISTYRWLCARHVAERQSAGWSCECTGAYSWLTCDDCEREARQCE